MSSLTDLLSKYGAKDILDFCLANQSYPLILNQENNQKNNLLHQAILEHKTDLIKQLNDDEYNKLLEIWIKEKNNDGNTPLDLIMKDKKYSFGLLDSHDLTINYNQNEILKIPLADFDDAESAKQNDGMFGNKNNLLHAAVDYNRSEILKLLENDFYSKDQKISKIIRKWLNEKNNYVLPEGGEKLQLTPPNLALILGKHLFEQLLKTLSEALPNEDDDKKDENLDEPEAAKQDILKNEDLDLAQALEVLRNDLSSKIQENKSPSESKSEIEYVTWLEERFTFHQLAKILRDFESKDKKTITDELKEFLKQRWDRIKNTNLVYTENSASEANKICVQLARILQDSLLDIDGLAKIGLNKAKSETTSKILTLKHVTKPQIVALIKQLNLKNDENLQEVVEFATTKNIRIDLASLRTVHQKLVNDNTLQDSHPPREEDKERLCKELGPAVSAYVYGLEAYPEVIEDSKWVPAQLCMLTENEMLSTHFNRFQLLMPTIDGNRDHAIEARKVSECLCEESLSLGNFILSEDNSMLVELLSTIDAASADKELRGQYYDLNNPSMILGDVSYPSLALTVDEKNRVLNHFQECNDFYKKLVVCIDYGNEKGKGGSELKALRDGLSMGGKYKGNGSEYYAGESAYVAISNFKTFIDSLEPEDRAKYLALTNSSGTKSIESVYNDNLTTKREDFTNEGVARFGATNSNYISAQFCVGCAAGTINEIYEHNARTFYNEDEFMRKYDYAETSKRNLMRKISQFESSDIITKVYGDDGDKQLIVVMQKGAQDDQFLEFLYKNFDRVEGSNVEPEWVRADNKFFQEYKQRKDAEPKPKKPTEQDVSKPKEISDQTKNPGSPSGPVQQPPVQSNNSGIFFKPIETNAKNTLEIWAIFFDYGLIDRKTGLLGIQRETNAEGRVGYRLIIPIGEVLMDGWREVFTIVDKSKVKRFDDYVCVELDADNFESAVIALKFNVDSHKTPESTPLNVETLTQKFTHLRDDGNNWQKIPDLSKDEYVARQYCASSRDLEDKFLTLFSQLLAGINSSELTPGGHSNV